MAEGKLQPADSSEDVPLPATKAPDFDLSDETVSGDDTDESNEQQPEAGAQGEPEGIFALFDREFDAGERDPIEPAESSEFDAEFSESFETMFTAVKGDGSAPLFETGEDTPPAEESEPENAEGSMPPLPRLDPEPQPPKPTVGQEEMEDLSLDDEPLEFTPSAPTPEATRVTPVPAQPRGIPFGSDEDDEDEDIPLALDEPEDLFFDISPEPPAASAAAPGPELEGWGVEEDGLEELNFDDSEDEEIYDRDLSGLMGDEDESEEEGSEDFDDFAKMALGFEDDDDEESVDEEDDFVVEELSGAKELDPFEEIAIMSSEDVAKYEPSFGSDELKFRDEEPLPEDESDPFAMEGESPRDEEELPEDLDPFGDGTPAAASGSRAKGSAQSSEDAADGDGAESDSEDEDSQGEGEEKKAAKKPRRSSGSGGGSKAGGAIVGLLSIPWKLFSTLTGILFGVLESVIGLLGKLPLIGLPFRLLSSVLSAVPMALKRLIVLLLIVIFFWGGSALVGSFLPKPSADVSLPDLGGASFSSVELKDGQITGEIENTGDVNLFLFPEVQVSERKVLQPGSWFSPVDLGTCRGPLTEVAVDTTVKVSFSCDVATDSSSSLKPALKE